MAQNGRSLQIEFHSKYGVTENLMSLKMECNSNGMSLKVECHSNWNVT